MTAALLLLLATPTMWFRDSVYGAMADTTDWFPIACADSYVTIKYVVPSGAYTTYYLPRRGTLDVFFVVSSFPGWSAHVTQYREEP